VGKRLGIDAVGLSSGRTMPVSKKVLRSPEVQVAPMERVEELEVDGGRR
jgi:hypothetical protein